MQEKSLHAALKAWYAQPDDIIEAEVGGYIIDIVRQGTLIEIQTRGFSAVKRKLLALLEQHLVRVVHPIPKARFVVRVDQDGVVVSRRKSPKRGTLYEVFRELVRIPTLIQHPHFSLDVLLVTEEQIWRDDGKGSWRRKGWSIYDRRLLQVVERVTFDAPHDFAALIPASLPTSFDCKELAAALRIQRPLAQKMAYSLREMGVLNVVGKRGKAYLYGRVEESSL
jgi:hypothetical protein